MSGRKGFTLVEIIISIIITGIVMYAVLAIFITSSVKGVNIEIFTTAQSLAEGKMEQVMARSFSVVTGESQANYSGDLADYSYQVMVDFVSREALDQPVAYETDYKKIKVLIRHPKLGYPTQVDSLKVSLD
ncbi:MAG: prepilin-type N-terminal cleavage/methylation domain-containing protein [Candidatus Margulisbacteria bacterium]|nr:prepilin-type N-terminal cleavage/methylation domain-containing protein [Candidatus Margulisiibacteriota bacterium]